MSGIVDPGEALNQFDRLDLDSVTQRRLACYVLREYFGTVLTNVGIEYLHFRDDIRTDSPRSQWQNIKTRLETLSGFEIPMDIAK